MHSKTCFYYDVSHYLYGNIINLNVVHNYAYHEMLVQAKLVAYILIFKDY